VSASDAPQPLVPVPSTDELPAPRTLAERAAWTQRDLRWEELLEEAARIGRDPTMTALSDADVEAAVCDLGAQLAAMTCRWLGFVAELVVRGIWADQGARTPAHWLSWKAGIASSTAREHVRVALRLRELPAIREAFAAGRLSYSKARALTRFAIPELEDLLLRWSQAATAAELDQIARNFRAAQRGRALAEHESPAPRYGWRERLEGPDTMLIELRLPVEEGLEVRQRLERRLQLAAAKDRASAEAGGEAVGAPDGTPAAAEVGSAAEAEEGTAADVDDAASAEAADGPAEVLHLSTGEELAQELLGIVLTSDPAGIIDTSGLDRHTLVLQTPITALEGDGEGPVPVRDAAGRIRSMSRRTLRRLACEAGIVLAMTDRDGAPIDLGRRTRKLSAALRRALHLRDRTCTFPGCHATTNLHGHHVQHWCDGGPTDIGNLVLLCASHHRFVHERGWTVEVAADGRHAYAPPGEDPVPRSGEQVAGPDGLALVPAGPRPPDALRPDHWGGPGSADHDLILAVLHQEFGRLAPDLLATAA
jgi:hypothetical protein